VVSLAHLLGADSPADLPLVVLAALMEHGQHHDRAIWSAPIRYPDRRPGNLNPQFPDLPFQVIGPRPAESCAPTVPVGPRMRMLLSSPSLLIMA
jgi:hypothetical protein